MDEAKLKQLTQNVEIIIKEAGTYVLSHQSEAHVQVDKGDNDYATNLDIESENMIVEKLSLLDDKFPVLAEEGHDPGESKIYWVVDPIDGTKNFFRGFPLWGINIALYDSSAEEILIGVVYFPKIGDLFSAYKNGGAYKNGVKINPSKVSNLSDAYLHVELPTNHSFEGSYEEFFNLVKRAFRVRGWGISAAICYVACGEFDAHIDYCGTTNSYDIYPAYLIAKEAGCRVDDLATLNKTSKGFTITNGFLPDSL